ncbi:MAG TPA: methyltransferase domain-containing protein [Jiangellaceae bacterium]
MGQDTDSSPVVGERNRTHREFWQHDGALQYQQYEETNEAVIAPFGEAMLEAARLQPGERVLDVGCGHGASTVEAAERVAPPGRVVGVDISATMLRAAQARLTAAGLNNVELLEADAQVQPFEPESFDAVISRFGVMFFDDPQAAFANLARALRPGGRLHFTCPQDPLKSEWVVVAFGAAIKAIGRTPELGPPGAAGPFAFADGDRLIRLLAASGFRDPRLESTVRPVRLGHDVDAAVDYILSLPESKQLFAGAPQETVGAAATALREGFAPYAGSHGVVLDAAAWLVSAHR